MYVCICKAITDKQLEDAQKSCKSMREICNNLGLGSECGACIQDAVDFVNKSKNNLKSNQKKNT
jgi:bacterioferritin-associated ferredoxin